MTLIGEAPSRTSDPTKPFSGRSGDRLRSLVPDLDERFVLANLFPSYPGSASKGTSWDAPGARERAADLAPDLQGLRVVFVGRRVAAAFGRFAFPWLEWQADDLFEFALLPHPSGIVRWWNSPKNVDAARAFLAAL